MTRQDFHIGRRQFLKVGGAVASIDLHGSALTDRETDQSSPERGEDLAALARRLPSANGLNTDSHLTFSLTRLDENATSLSGLDVTEATAYGTVFAGRTATDIAFGLDDARAVRSRLTGGYETVGTHAGWPVFHRNTRTRHRVIAVTDSTAVIGVGPIRGTVRNDVIRTLAAVSGRPSGPESDRETRRAVLEHLGSGNHVAVDLTPDPHRTPATVEATGERYELRGETVAVRTVVLFDTPAHARAANREDFELTPTLQRPAATDCSHDCHGRAIVRDATIPSTAFPVRP